MSLINQLGDPNAQPDTPSVTPQTTSVDNGSNDLQEAQATQPQSRLQAIISAVAKVGSTGLAGIPERGRPSFVTGLGSGARAEKQVEATQQAIKFRDFDSQVRLAQLHNQDLKL